MASSRTRDAWTTAASTLGLRFVRGDAPTSSVHRLDLEGTVGGFPITVKARSSDKSQWTDVTIEVDGLPAGFSARRRTITLLSFLPRRGVKTGDPGWDAAMVVKASDPSAAEVFLGPERREVIRQAVSVKPRPRIRKSKITITHQGIVKDAAVITDTVRRLAGLAEDLDLSPPTVSLQASATRTSASSTALTAVAWVMVAVVIATWIFGAGSVDPLALIGISAVPLIVASIAFTRARRG